MSVTVHHGDSREVLKSIADATFDSVVCDPPYALVSIGKRFGADNAAPAKTSKTGAYARASAGFMGKKWDTGDTAFDPEFWAEVLRVIKPGGHLIAFSGTRTYHRLVCAIEDAGFEIRDQIGWLFGSGFPKSHNQAGEWEGWGSALKPAWEPICLARAPMIGTIAANLAAHGTGALNIDASRIEATDNKTFDRMAGDRSREQYRTGTTGAGRPTDKGRWPANVIHDGSEEVIAAFPDSAPGSGSRPAGATARPFSGVNCGPQADGSFGAHGDAGVGSAARFFYSAKADSADRCGSKHPTVKPIDLMAYLCRLVTRPGGLVLDPFAGSGSTGMACLREGFDCVLIEREAEYVADIYRRLQHVAGEDTPLFSNDADPGLLGDAA